MEGGKEHLIDIFRTACFPSATSPLIDGVYAVGRENLWQYRLSIIRGM